MPSALTPTASRNASSNTSSSMTTTVRIVAARVSASSPAPRQKAASFLGAGLAEQPVERPCVVVDRGASRSVVLRGAQQFLAELAHDVAPDIEVIGLVARGDARWLELASRNDVIQARCGGHLGDRKSVV